MKISSDTTIGAIVKYNPKAIDVIVSLNKIFERLRNPILRKLLAGKVTVQQASRIGNIQPQTFLKALADIGFEVDFREKVSKQAAPMNAAASFTGKQVTLDVREDIRTGKDPFNKIMKAIKSLNTDEELKLISPFEPVPLISLLENKNYAVKHEIKNKDEHHTLIRSFADDIETVNPRKRDDLLFNALIEKYAGELEEINVTHLEMPLPLVTILEKLESLPPGKALHVFHKRIPQFLLAHLIKDGWNHKIKEVDENDVRLIIYR